MRKIREFFPGHFGDFLREALRIVGFFSKLRGGRPGSQGVCTPNFVNIGPETKIFCGPCNSPQAALVGYPGKAGRELAGYAARSAGILRWPHRPLLPAYAVSEVDG